jgi:GDP-L-fucose synthase
MKKSKVLVTGGSGLIGSKFPNETSNHAFIKVGSQQFDLTKESECQKMFDNVSPDAVIHLAAKVGGIKSNMDKVADFFDENSKINLNVLSTAKNFGVTKLVSVMSTCVYPDAATYPLTPDQIHNGPPHPSNFGYAYAKRMLEVQTRAYRNQYGLSWKTAIPGNAYGENDNFDLQNSHVIPAIVRKVFEAKQSGQTPVFWGDGLALREFTYSEDVAKILAFLLDNYNCEEPINIGNTQEVSIKYVVEEVSKTLGYSGPIAWSDSGLKGQFRKPSSNKKLLELGWKSSDYTAFECGLKKTCDWFVQNYPNIRGC